MSFKQRARTHDETRAEVCLMHFGKGSSMRPISKVDLARIKEFFLPSYDVDDQKLPCGLCARCRKLLYEIAMKKKEKVQPNFPPLDFGGLTGRQLKDLLDCMCSLCKIGRVLLLPLLTFLVILPQFP